MADEYISKDAAIDRLEKLMQLQAPTARAIIEAIPAADVQPVRHGRWIKDSDGLTICSECEEVALQRVFIKLPEKIVDLQMRKSHYCPNCGARLDLEEDDGV